MLNSYPKILLSILPNFCNFKIRLLSSEALSLLYIFYDKHLEMLIVEATPLTYPNIKKIEKYSSLEFDISHTSLVHTLAENAQSPLYKIVFISLYIL